MMEDLVVGEFPATLIPVLALWWKGTEELQLVQQPLSCPL